MHRKMIKISRILLYYSVVVTALLLLIFVIFIKTISIPLPGLPKYFVIAKDETVIYGIQNDMYSSVIAKEKLENYYIDMLLKNVPVIVICLIVIIIIGTIILSKILNWQSEKEMLLIAKQLSRIDEEDMIMEQHPAVIKAYQEVKKKLNSYVLDFSRFNAYVTHEQKNILSLLRAKLQLSENYELTAEVDRVTDSLDDILTLSSSKSMVKTEIVDVALLCANVCDDYKKIYPRIYFDFDDDANNLIHARELWICRAVSNLIGNAVKYSGNSEIHVLVTNKKGSVIVTVSDGGEGINEPEREKLFDYQYRVGKLKKDGYGIGLSLVRHVCELCNGFCWAENREVVGTTFYMIFPEALTLD